MTQMHNLALATALALASPLLAAQTTQLTPPDGRISDAAIQRDHQSYEALQARIKGLNERGRAVHDYHLSKAQCWLDVSLHEYSRNDRSAFPQGALAESEKLIQTMERNTGALPMDTPLINDALRLRPDLWQRAAALKGQVGFRCAQQPLACAEVELVHAGNEERQQGWRHAKPYVQTAEDLMGRAATLAEACAVPVVAAAPVAAQTPTVAPAAPVAVVAAATAPPAAPVAVPQLAAAVLFNFDKHDAANMHAASVAQLEALVRKVQTEKLVLQSVRLSGHADRLGKGRADYNLRLSEKRVATVKQALVQLGIDGKLVQTVAHGDAQPVHDCGAQGTATVGLRRCLQPNRRVDVLIDARRP